MYAVGEGIQDLMTWIYWSASPTTRGPIEPFCCTQNLKASKSLKTSLPKIFADTFTL